MDNEKDKNLDDFMQEAFDREDVYRFKQLVAEVAEDVKAEDETEDPGIVITLDPNSEQNDSRRLLAIAAVFVVLVGSVFWFLPSSLNGPQLAMASLEDPHLSISRSEPNFETAADSIKHQLSLFLIDGKHSDFLAQTDIHLKNIEVLGEEANWVRLYRGYVLLKQENQEGALMELEGLQQPSAVELAQKNFYLGLIALMNEDVDSSKKHLGAVKEYPWIKYAKGVLKEL